MEILICCMTVVLYLALVRYVWTGARIWYLMGQMVRAEIPVDAKRLHVTLLEDERNTSNSILDRAVGNVFLCGAVAVLYLILSAFSTFLCYCVLVPV